MVPDDRNAILARRRRFVLAALGSMTAAAIGCDEGEPEVCLDFAPPGGAGGTGGEAGQGGTGGPQVCLFAPPGGMGGTGGSGGQGG